MHRSRLIFTLALVLLLSASVSMTSCGGGGGSGGSNPDLVLLGFNVPNLSGIPLNQPLIFTFSANIDPSSITPDSLRVVGTPSDPKFGTTVVDGNLVALLPEIPNFADYSDAGFAADNEYTVSMTTFPAVTTINSTTGKPLLSAASFTFRTLPAPSPDIVSNIRCSGPDGINGTADDTTPSSASFFIEPRRPIRHGRPPSLGGESDDDGCLQNSDNLLYVAPSVDPSAVQSGSGPGARLLCMQNEGSPRIIEEASTPTHNQLAVGSPSAVSPGLIDLPAIRVKVNEPLDPLTIEPFFAGIPVNVQLWRVALQDGSFTGPDQIQTNKPIVNQEIDDTEIILVPAGPVPQGAYVINITPAVKDLPGCPLRINDRPDPAEGGYDQYEAQPAFQGAIPPGYRIYFKTLQVPNTPLSIIEDFNNNLAEWGDNQSTNTEPGFYSDSHPDVGDLTFDGDPMAMHDGPFPYRTMIFDPGADSIGLSGGQSTSALWNGSGTATPGGPIGDVNGYRFLNIPTLSVPDSTNPINPPSGRLLHNSRPYRGSGQDSSVTVTTGSNLGLNSDTGSANGDGIYEYVDFTIEAGATVSVIGTKPLLILCQGTFTCHGTLELNGAVGGHGFDTDGSAAYTNAGAVSSGGRGGQGGPGGGNGGHGADPLGVDVVLPLGDGNPGNLARTMFDQVDVPFAGTTPGLGGTFFLESAGGANDGSQGGGGGGYAGSGTPGSTSAGATSATGGSAFGSADHIRDIALFQPDRAYQRNTNVSGGTAGGGGSIEDDNGTSETGDGVNGPGDDGGAGGGGAGGALWIFADAIDVTAAAVISAAGGAGGNTYGPGEQLISPGDDGTIGNADDIFLGLAPGAPAVGTGDGGPGGGGAGGAIFMIAKTGLSVAAGATLDVAGGAGGTSNHGGRVGGTGSVGRVTLLTHDGAPPPVDGTGTAVTVPPFRPSIEDQSTGQSEWVDLFTPTADFAPIVGGIAQFPSHSGNFQFPGAAIPGFLETPTAMMGGGQTYGFGAGTFDARFEFQGADFLMPDPTAGTPTSADGLTTWYDVSQIDLIDGKRFFRWRWRFWTVGNYGQNAGDPVNLPVPTVFDLTIPFTK